MSNRDTKRLTCKPHHKNNIAESQDYKFSHHWSQNSNR